MKQRVTFYPDRCGVSVKGSLWTLWLQKVKTKKDNHTLYVVKPLKAHYNPETKEFHYEDLSTPIWLEPADFGQLISILVQIRDSKEVRE